MSTEISAHFISKNGAVFVASVTGAMNDASLDSISELIQIVSDEQDAKFFVLNLTNVGSIDPSMYPSLSLLQLKMRSSERHLRVCGLGSDLREKLLAMGLLRRSEINTELQDALVWITTQMKIDKQRSLRAKRAA